MCKNRYVRLAAIAMPGSPFNGISFNFTNSNSPVLTIPFPTPGVYFITAYLLYNSAIGSSYTCSLGFSVVSEPFIQPATTPVISIGNQVNSTATADLQSSNNFTQLFQFVSSLNENSINLTTIVESSVPESASCSSSPVNITILLRPDTYPPDFSFFSPLGLNSSGMGSVSCTLYRTGVNNSVPLSSCTGSSVFLTLRNAVNYIRVVVQGGCEEEVFSVTLKPTIVTCAAPSNNNSSFAYIGSTCDNPISNLVETASDESLYSTSFAFLSGTRLPLKINKMSYAFFDTSNWITGSSALISVSIFTSSTLLNSNFAIYFRRDQPPTPTQFDTEYDFQLTASTTFQIPFISSERWFIGVLVTPSFSFTPPNITVDISIKAVSCLNSCGHGGSCTLYSNGPIRFPSCSCLRPYTDNTCSSRKWEKRKSQKLFDSPPFFFLSLN